MDTRTPSSWPTVATVVVLLTAVTGLLLTAFAWPSVRSDVHDVPIAVAGPPSAVERVTAALDRSRPGAFDVTEVRDTAAAERLIRDREVYGAVDVSSGGAPRVIVASAAGATVAQTLQGVGAALGRAPDQGGAAAPAPGPARDLVPLPADDPRGAGLTAGALPLVMGGLLAALLLTRLVRGTARRVVGALAFALCGGLAVAAILQFWLGSLDGSYAANAGALALTVAATSLTVIGLESLLGAVGFAVGAVTMMLIGNPLSATATAPEMLPGWSGELGRLLPPGAGGQLLRSTAFFDGHGATHPVTVLLVWLALGAALLLVGTLRPHHRDRPDHPAVTPVPTAPTP
ncbi:ABC transporter permease [Streptomyces sp. NPDC003327]